MEKRRGRPRQYDPERALDAALEVFWRKGFAETSLDDLATATGMNRPSLYAAFGDKRALYLRTLERFGERMSALQRRTLRAADCRNKTPAARLASFFRAALVQYLGDVSRGCMAVSTLSVSAPMDADMRHHLRKMLERMEREMRVWLQQLVQDELLSREADLEQLAWQAIATLISLGVHARAGCGDVRLRRLAKKSAEALLP